MICGMYVHISSVRYVWSVAKRKAGFYKFVNSGAVMTSGLIAIPANLDAGHRAGSRRRLLAVFHRSTTFLDASTLTQGVGFVEQFSRTLDLVLGCLTNSCAGCGMNIALISKKVELDWNTSVAQRPM
jgi:hypothetical protein